MRVSHITCLSFYSPYSSSYSVCVSFSTFSDFIDIFQVLHCAFLTFYIFQSFLPYSRPAQEAATSEKGIELSEEEATFDDGNTETASRPAQVPEEKLDETFTSIPPEELGDRKSVV